MTLLRLLAYLWAFPATLVGLVFVPLAALSGGSVRIVEGALEVEGGLVAWFLRRGLPFLPSAAAMCLGHVILGRNQQCLDKSRRHEHVHIRQYERWGPLLIPVYLGVGLILLLRGYDPYLDNPFEKEAYEDG